MLIIAQPKSASTSLVSTLCKITGKTMALGSGKKQDKKCEGFEELQKCHSIMGQKDWLFLNKIIKDKKKICREHILPIDEHLRILQKFDDSILILLRKPEDSWDSYIRMFDKNKNKWIDRNKLLEDLKKFYYTYIKSNLNLKDNFMIIFYSDLILNYENIMKKVLKHFQLHGTIISLQKRKYTGIGVKRLIKRNE